MRVTVHIPPGLKELTLHLEYQEPDTTAPGPENPVKCEGKDTEDPRKDPLADTDFGYFKQRVRELMHEHRPDPAYYNTLPSLMPPEEPAVMTPDRLFSRATSLTRLLMGIPRDIRRQELRCLKQRNEVMHSLVLALMEELRRDAGGDDQEGCFV